MDNSLDNPLGKTIPWVMQIEGNWVPVNFNHMDSSDLPPNNPIFYHICIFRSINYYYSKFSKDLYRFMESERKWYVLR